MDCDNSWVIPNRKKVTPLVYKNTYHPKFQIKAPHNVSDMWTQNLKTLGAPILP